MGRVTRMDYPHGWVEEYEYDAIGQLLNVTDSDPSGKDMKQQKHVYRYDDCGNMTYEYMRGNGTGEATVENDYSYDALHRVVRAEEHFGHEVREYTYDSLGNLTYEKDSHNYYVDYILNDLNQIVESSTDGWKTRTTYTYDGRGNLTEKVYGKNKKVTTTAEYIFDETNKMVLGYNALRESSAYTYNGLGALVTNTWTIAKNGYGYHDVDALASEAEVLSGQELMEALEVYDEAELTDVVKFHHFGDELAPNLEAPTVDEEVSTAPGLSDDPAEPDAGIEPASANGNSAGNNGQGNGNAAGNGDGNGSINKTSTVVKEFVVDYNTETFEPLMEHEVNGLDYKYVYGNDRLSVDISPINNSGKLIENGDHIRLYYHMDYLGTADYLTSPVSGKVEAWTHYNEWGLIVHNAVLKCGQRELDLVKRYATHDYDSVLELYYAKARFYDAHDRRFTAVDPILDPSGYGLREYVQNPIQLVQYLYVENAPTIKIDLDGRVTITYIRTNTKVDIPTVFVKDLGLVYRERNDEYLDYYVPLSAIRGSQIINAKNMSEAKLVGSEYFVPLECLINYSNVLNIVVDTNITDWVYDSKTYDSSNATKQANQFVRDMIRQDPMVEVYYSSAPYYKVTTKKYDLNRFLLKNTIAKDVENAKRDKEHFDRLYENVGKYKDAAISELWTYGPAFIEAYLSAYQNITIPDSADPSWLLPTPPTPYYDKKMSSQSKYNTYLKQQAVVMEDGKFEFIVYQNNVKYDVLFDKIASGFRYRLTNFEKELSPEYIVARTMSQSYKKVFDDRIEEIIRTNSPWSNEFKEFLGY